MIIENKKLLKLLQKKDELVQKGRDQYGVVEKEQEKLNKCGLQIQKVKDKVAPIMKKYIDKWKKDGTLGEFDEIETIEVKGGKVVAKKFNRVEDFKRQLREQYAQNEEDNSKSDAKAETADNDAK